jgi:hypothetical protein
MRREGVMGRKREGKGTRNAERTRSCRREAKARQRRGKVVKGKGKKGDQA